MKLRFSFISVFFLMLVVIIYFIANLGGVINAPRSGETRLHFLGILGGGLILLSACGYLLKRLPLSSGGSQLLSFFHIQIGMVGFVLASIHVSGRFGKLPLLVFLALLGLVLTGIYGRFFANLLPRHPYAQNFQAFQFPASKKSRSRLNTLLEQKQHILNTIAPLSIEGLFSLQLQHWLRNPIYTWRYYLLDKQENSLARSQYRFREENNYLLQSHWRTLHLIMLILTLLGLITHITVTLFFPDIASRGSEVYWWHIGD